MNVLSAMAGITDGEFCKKFTKQNVDMITLGGYNTDMESFKAGLENSVDNRREFLTCPHHLSVEVSEQVELIKEYNPSWNGLINVNLRGTKPDSFKLLKDNKDIDILEINAHCRQTATVNAGAGQALLQNTDLLSEILEEVSQHSNYDLCVKIRANVDNVDTLKIIELIESYNVKYLHVDATNPGVMEADYDILNKITSSTNMHVIGNNSVTCHEDYLKMKNTGVDSVSVARAAMDGDVTHIFNEN
ncbi:tRNA-dihydrouridine synthase [Methanosphaera sp.]